MAYTLDIFRFDQATDEVPHRDRVEITELPDTATVLYALEHAKAEIDWRPAQRWA